MQDKSAVPASPPPNQTKQLTQPPTAASAPLPAEDTLAKKNQELVRQKNLLFSKATRITESFSMNQRIGNSGCDREIEDEYWKILTQNPLDFYDDDKLDEEKVYQTYKATARSFGVRMW